MSGPLNKEAKTHRLMNQRRIAFSLIERIQTLLASGIVFNRELNQLFRSQGRFGSRDRRLYRELIFAYLRYKPWLDPMREDQERFFDNLLALANPTPEIVSLYPTLGRKPIPHTKSEDRHHLIGKTDDDLETLLSSWFQSHLTQPLDLENRKALFSRPPLWLRVQHGDPDQIVQQLRRAAPPSTRPPQAIWGVPDAIRCPADLPLSKVPAYEAGQIEVQDISSQLLLQLVHPQPEGRWLDACAGAGGKTLQLAKMLGARGKVVAYDPRSDALDDLEKRSRRAGLKNIEITREKPEHGSFDGVLVDAPCSGSGTWRRHPFLMRQIREKDVLKRSQIQKTLLDFYANRVSAGGTLAYVTCSLSRIENELVASHFLETRKDFEHAPLAKNFDLEETALGITIHPAQFNGDGLYIATFKRR